MILASTSPRRRELLALLGIPFTIQGADIDETVQAAERPRDHVLRLAGEKARRVASQRQGECVLAADTIVVQHGRILGKPRDADEARRMLQSLRAAPHQVLTAVAIARYPAAGASEQPLLLSEVHASQVSMRPYSDEEIEDYIATGDPFDKAGGYAIQHPHFRPVAHFEGCFASIMGLPLGVVARLLSAAGLRPTPDWPRRCQALTGRCCQFTSA
ncbi:MAG: septum formation protein Maf [Caldilineae bacterium]|nr:MAG: septum formation protein Maf [Caldilineae bacterium]